MGTECVSNLNHSGTLRKLSKKLPFFFQGKLVESASQIIKKERKPVFVDFLKFVKSRARLVNNVFAGDLLSSTPREKIMSDKKINQPVSRVVTMATGLTQEQSSQQKEEARLALGWGFV